MQRISTLPVLPMSTSRIVIHKPGVRSVIISALCAFAAFSYEPEEAAAASASQQYFTESRDGTQIAYYVSGSVRSNIVPLLVISGGPGSDHRYMRVGGAFDQLAETRTIIMFDQRGTSLSGDAGSAPELSDWAHDVEAIRQAVEAPQIDLLGHSFGGYVATAYVEEYGEFVRSIVFADCALPKLSDNRPLLKDIFPDRFPEWKERRQSLPPRFNAPEISIFFSMEFVDPQLAKAYTDAVSDLIYNVSVNNDLRADLATLDFTSTIKSLKQPTLIIHGRFDAVIAPSVAWSLHAMLPDSELAFIEKAGHLPFVEQPTEFAETVSAFLMPLDH